MNIEPISVAELNQYIKNSIDNDEYLNNVYVRGEISNFTHHYTGHMYFTLKDENSLIKCIMFKGYTANLSFVPKNGQKVMILGTVSVFERDGVYQIYCKAMKQDGIGDLYQKYEELKKQLEDEGLFDKSHKKKIPLIPKSIGVVSSNTGAVIRDIVNISTRRNPNEYIKLFPVPVQGEGAAIKIANAIEEINKHKLSDVIIVARGGGSLEDLWPFNEEIVARAIYKSEIPVVSAVGHETDFSISDFVADLRASTPSEAAELVVTDIKKANKDIDNFIQMYKKLLEKKLEKCKNQFEICMLNKVFKEPCLIVNEEYIRIDSMVKNITDIVMKRLEESKVKTLGLISKVDTLSPLKILTRGYSIVQLDGKTIRSSKELKNNDEVNIKMIDGDIKARIL